MSMTHPRNTQHERMRTPRTLSDAFGPYAKLHVEPKRNGPREYAWMAACGVCIGIVWYGCFLIGVTR